MYYGEKADPGLSIQEGGELDKVDLYKNPGLPIEEGGLSRVDPFKYTKKPTKYKTNTLKWGEGITPLSENLPIAVMRDGKIVLEGPRCDECGVVGCDQGYQCVGGSSC